MTSASSLSDSQIQNALAPYGAHPSAELCSAIRVYVELLIRWSRRISLTTVTDRDEILRFHIGESIAAISKVPIENGRLADVGSGPGIPGIPLALFVPGLNVTLIESNTKKATFLSEVQRQLSLSNVRVFQGRAEDLSRAGAFDFVTARAVGKYGDLLSWSSKILNSSGKVVLWLGERDVRQVAGNPGWHWLPAQKIHGSKGRFLLVASLA